MLRVWNVTLVIVTFFLTIFGTFMTRSGIVQSVHAFGQDNELALLFILFMAFILIISFGLMIFRMPRLRAQGSFESFWSREFAFLMNNWVDTTPAPKPSNAKIVNDYEALLARAKECRAARGRWPNLVAVDFYRTGDLFRAARELNDEAAPVGN